jgi:acyl carrier protein
LFEELVGVDAAEVTLDKSFIDDLDVDSLSMVELVVAAEEEFNIRIPDENLRSLRTVSDAVSDVQRAI